jgi:KaiC/GvpD/RAD55 family RecA-like ATPase
MMDKDEVMEALMEMMGVSKPKPSPFKKVNTEDSVINPQDFGFERKTQQALPVHPLLDSLCLDAEYRSLGGLPVGSTIMLDGFPGSGKTRTCMEALLRAAASGIRSVYVVSEEGYSDKVSGRDDLHSRLIKLADALGIAFEEAAANYVVVQIQYHRGQSWQDFVDIYQNLVEKQKIKFAVIDSLTGLDPLNTKSVSNLNLLKTYNHDHGITALVTSQVKESGFAAGGNAMMHTADVVFHIEKIGLSSKEMAAKWGGEYRDKVTVISAIKSNTTPVFPSPVRVRLDPFVATLAEHPDNPNRLPRNLELPPGDPGEPLISADQTKEERPKRVTNKMIAAEIESWFETGTTNIDMNSIQTAYIYLTKRHPAKSWATEERLNKIKEMMGIKKGTGIDGVDVIDW